MSTIEAKAKEAWGSIRSNLEDRSVLHMDVDDELEAEIEAEQVEVIADAIKNGAQVTIPDHLLTGPMMHPVSSSNIAAVGYQPHTCTLVVDFTNGTRYSYANVPPDVHEAMMAAESVGKFFNQLVRPAFKATPLPKGDDHEDRHRAEGTAHQD